MSGMWKRSHGRTSEAPPDERGGYRYVRPTATAPHLDSTLCRLYPAKLRSTGFAPQRPWPTPPNNRAVGCGQLVIRFGVQQRKSEVSLPSTVPPPQWHRQCLVEALSKRRNLRASLELRGEIT